MQTDSFAIRVTIELKPSTINFTPNIGGGERVRTDDLLRARQALSQLSYTPQIQFRVSSFGLKQLQLLVSNPKIATDYWWA